MKAGVVSAGKTYSSGIVLLTGQWFPNTEPPATEASEGIFLSAVFQNPLPRLIQWV